MKKYYLCFSCANVFEHKEDIDIICPKCKHKISSVRYNKIYKYASDSAYYGYDYRCAYEEQLKEDGEINTHYSLIELGQAVDFVTIAAISGIIGGLSHDALKVLCRKIRNSIVRRKDIPVDKIDLILNNDDEFLRFIEYIKSFNNGMNEVDSRVKSAIIEERVVDAATEKAHDLLITQLSEVALIANYSEPYENKVIFNEKLYESKEEIQQGKKIRVDYFNNMWDKVEK